MRLNTIVAAGFALIVSAGAAQAAIVTVATGQDFSSAPFTYDFGGGNSLTFTLVDPSFFAYNPAGISTGGSTQVLSLGAPFYNPPQPTSFFSDRGGTVLGSLGQYVSYATPAAIPFSIVEGLVALRFDLGAGYQYGFADLTGGRLAGIRFNTVPGGDIAFGAIPEPASWALLIGGFGLTGAAMRRRRTAVAA